MSKTPPTEQSIFLVARQIQSPPEQQAYLTQICGEDEKLRASVEALLAADDQSRDILAIAENLAPTTAPDTIDCPGDHIGPYKLLEQIGEGGMGVVYMAEQKEPVRRRVALKIIKPGMDTKLVVARFEAERQALALMEHQNIARVLDAGETRNGLPYFVMELVKGIPIAEYCDSNQVPHNVRLELFRQVCHAIAHSHQKGIIHRDIKPNNVLVCNYDGKPVPKVIDFGVAKATHQQLTEKTLYTQHGQVVGTLEYMSPEQAELSQLDIDTRSDIYSLGVLLYELLTGSTPITKDQIKSTALLEMLRVIREEEAEKPSTRLSRTGNLPTQSNDHLRADARKLKAKLRNELDWIVLKALEKDRQRRYETVNALDKDIARYLADEPVEACPPSLSYRARKFSKRHQKALVRSAGVVMLLAFSAGFLFWNQASKSEIRREYEQGLAINAALQGQLGVALNHANNADKHGADSLWIHKLAGIVELYSDHGSSASAIDELNKALRDDQDNVAIMSLLAIAFVWNGNWEDHERMLADASSATLESDDLEGHFFLGQALMWSDPERSVKLLRHVYKDEQWKTFAIVKMMLGEALVKMAWATNEEEYALEGIHLSEIALAALPNSKSARAVNNYCNYVAADIRRSNGLPYVAFLDKCVENVHWIQEQDDFLIGYPNRAWYFDLRGTEDAQKTAHALWRSTVVDHKAGGWFASCYAAESYRMDTAATENALAEIKANRSDPDVQFARLMLMMDVDPDANREEAISICRSVPNIKTSRVCADVQLMMWLRLGELDAAKLLAKELMSDREQPNVYQVIAETSSADVLLGRTFHSRISELHDRLLLAMFQMAKGEQLEAIATLEPAVRFGGCMINAQPHHWARALYERPFAID